MTGKHKKRLFQILAGLLAASVAIVFVLLALKENIQLYYTPSEIIRSSLTSRQVVRMGGLVLQDSIKRDAHSLKVNFVVTDGLNEVPVGYEGVLPDLFREGQGVIVKGTYAKAQTFQAQEVLTKHDERYVPRELQSTIKGAK